ncbi:hypothetical protein DIPPA_09964 [Diplonema papillatum]|nr:hypothetical protein DIPPA_09964 [Diplonema papillatum]
MAYRVQHTQRSYIVVGAIVVLSLWLYHREENRVAELKEEAGAIEHEKAVCQDRMHLAEKRLSAALGEIEKLMQARDKVLDELSRSKATVKSLEPERDNLQAGLRSAVESSREKDETLSRCTTGRSACDSSLSDCNADLASSHEALERSHDQLSDLKAQLAASKAANRKAQEAAAIINKDTTVERPLRKQTEPSDPKAGKAAANNEEDHETANGKLPLKAGTEKKHSQKVATDDEEDTDELPLKAGTEKQSKKAAADDEEDTDELPLKKSGTEKKHAQKEAADESEEDSDEQLLNVAAEKKQSKKGTTEASDDEEDNGELPLKSGAEKKKPGRLSDQKAAADEENSAGSDGEELPSKAARDKKHARFEDLDDEHGAAGRSEQKPDRHDARGGVKSEKVAVKLDEDDAEGFVGREHNKLPAKDAKNDDAKTGDEESGEQSADQEQEEGSKGGKDAASEDASAEDSSGEEQEESGSGSESQAEGK